MTKGLFSVVVALYGVVDYVDVFLQSLRNQTFPFTDLDIVIVDDESIDGSYDRAKEWAHKYPDVVRVFTKTNGGPASARNIGIEQSRGEWITFCDPDDALQPQYFESIASFISRDQKSLAAMISSRVMIWHEASGKVADTHPLRKKYMFGERLVDLEIEPNYIQLGAASCFFRRDVLERNELLFDERIRPTFEDAEFISRYLELFEATMVGYVPAARYMYRKRHNGTSLVQSSWSKPERYDDVLQYGYLAMLKNASRKYGHVPTWIQNTVLYDIQWYFKDNTKLNSSSDSLTSDQLEVFHDLLRQIFYYIDAETIDKFSIMNLPWMIREALLVRYKGYGVRIPRAYNFGIGPSGLYSIVYCYSGSSPDERFEIDGYSVDPNQAKSTTRSFFREDYFIQRTLWFEGGKEVKLWLDGEFVPIISPNRPGWPKPKGSSLSLHRNGSTKNSIFGRRIVASAFYKTVNRSFPYPIAKAEALSAKIDNRIAIEKIVSATESSSQAISRIGKRVISRRAKNIFGHRDSSRDQQTILWARSAAMRSKYYKAWIIMDRVMHADDNGEHLYRHISSIHPDCNVWFLLDRRSHDWQRLENEGFRLVDFNSKEAIALSLNAEFQISSDATGPVQHPIDRRRFGISKAKLVFLQHGVIHNDLSKWLNQKNLTLFITSTKAEYESIVRDESNYKFTSNEVVLTGLPRFDSLIRKSREVEAGAAQKDFLVVMPTWRQELRTSLNGVKSDADRLTILEESQYIREWYGFMRSSALRKACEDSGCQAVFVPHPNLRGELAGLELPTHISVVNPGEISIQDILSRARMLVTDYSSIGFDAAVAGATVIYFQFDALEVFSGKQNYVKGDFDYELEGFGPVVTDKRGLEAYLADHASSRFAKEQLYEDRIKSTFAFFDENNSERVYQAILAKADL